MWNRNLASVVVTGLSVGCALTACGGGGGSSGGGSPPPPPPPPPAPTFGITGTVSGLSGTVVLQRNGANDQTVTASGAVTLGTALASGTNYIITVLTQPGNPAQDCVVANGTGTLSANVSNVTITCTSIPLVLNTTSPTNGSTDVARDVAPVLTFSRALDATTIVPANITLTSAAGARPLTLVTAGTLVTANTGGKLLPLAEYTLAVSTGVRGAAGEQLANNMSAVFTTRDGQWGNAELVENIASGAAQSVQLGFDSSGIATAVWRQDDGTRFNIWSNRYLPGTGWAAPTLIENNTGDADEPQIAVNAAGEAMAVWEQEQGADTNIWANRYTPAGGWAAAELIEFITTIDALKPAVGIAANGVGQAAWQQNNAPDHRVYINRYQVNSGWGAPTIADTGAQSSANVQIAVNDLGDALYVWEQSDGTRTNIRSNRRTQAGLGSPILIETNNSGDASAVQIAGDAAGNAHAVWMQFNGSAYDVWTNRYTVGTGWGTATLLENASGSATTPQIALSANGDAHAVWIQNDPTGVNVMSARYTAAAGWSSPNRIETGAGGTGAARIAVDARGNAIAVWMQAGAVGFDVWANRYITGAGWGTAVLLEFSNAPTSLPKIAIDANGNALAVWAQGSGSDWSIWSSRFE